ncbi:N-acetylmuramoyl-L-alanine amidase [Flavobacterium agricola]|uniref:N-acetylmuramoyl-L-alanine amidase n=1 Tax=Flavobacterium agricola TaxID=2870839 RepID=A0ABY6M131_9FLAO|nr:N-acetylmuramoyl-L-alanine amidase [Flavobacterium agricola]UYW02231.1 N-acetylmuramoyl-L-alanine amidase [Flavobacterium agricola]
MKKNYILTLLIVLFFVPICVTAQNGKFKVVLDAGHGGKDPGAIANGVKEKDVVLATTLLVGEMLEKEKDIEVVYTRKTDVFIELANRPKIANAAHANVFVSIHCNSAAKAPAAHGTETFVMGVTKNASNLEVARRENEVITLESDYKIKYDGYDPKSPESVIGTSILQEDNLIQSIELAAALEKNFEGANRYSRGVKQAGFLVLRDIYMPRVLIELGFLTNKNEAKYLDSAAGQRKLAQQIANSIISYKKEYYGGDNLLIADTAPSTTIATNVSDSKAINNVEFKVQISASGKKLELKAQNFKGLSPISIESAGNLYRYYYGSTSSYDAAKELLKQAQAKGYDSAFVVAYKDGKKVSVSEALK